VISDEKSTVYAGASATSFNEVVLDSDSAGGIWLCTLAKDTSTYFGLVSSSQIVKC